MRTKIPQFLLLLCLLFGSAGLLPGQNSSTNGVIMTPKGNVHALVIFVGFLEDGPTTSTPEWAFNQLPTWAQNPDNEIFNLSPANIGAAGNPENMSLWYHEMSLGSFQFTGEIFPQMIRVNRNSPTGGGLPHNTIHTAVMDEIRQNFPNYDFSPFDQRQNRPNGVYDNSLVNANGTPASGDGILDFVILVHRTPGDNGYVNPFASQLNIQNSTSGNYNVRERFIVSGTPFHSASLGLLKHEFGHALYNGPHLGGANNTTGVRFYRNGAEGMAVGDYLFYTSSAWERWHLGWSTITHDLSDINDNGIYTLRDFLTTGDNIRIKLPVGDQYLWIENHQKKGVFDRSVFKTNALGQSGDIAPKGVYMYVEDLRPTQSIITNAVGGDVCNKIKALHGNGHFDYQPSDDFIIEQRWWGQAARDFTEIAPNPMGEHHPNCIIRADYNGDGIISYNSNGNSGSGNEGAAIYIRNGQLIDGIYAEDMNFPVGSKAGLGHNPAIANITTYNAGTETLSPTFLHNISVEILSINAAGDATIRVSFDDPEVDQDIRWTGHLDLRNDPINTINNPQQIKLKSGRTLLLDQSQTPSKRTEITLGNGEKSFSLPSLLTLENGTETTLEGGSNLRVVEGSSLWIRSGATLNVLGSGKLSIEDGAFLCIEPGAIINLSGAQSEIDFSPSASIGINPLLSISPASCLDLCGIQALLAGNGSAGTLNRTYLADAGEDFIVCSSATNFDLGGTPAASGGTAPYTYAWSPATGLNNAALPNPTYTASLSATTTFNLSVTDNQGCTDVDEVEAILNPNTLPAPGLLSNSHLEMMTAGSPDAFTAYQVSNEPSGTASTYYLSNLLPADQLSQPIGSPEPAPNSGCLSVNLPMSPGLPTYYAQTQSAISLAPNEVYLMEAQVKVDKMGNSGVEEFELALTNELSVPGTGMIRKWTKKTTLDLDPVGSTSPLKTDWQSYRTCFATENYFGPGQLQNSALRVFTSHPNAAAFEVNADYFRCEPISNFVEPFSGQNYVLSSFLPIGTVHNIISGSFTLDVNDISIDPTDFPAAPFDDNQVYLFRQRTDVAPNWNRLTRYQYNSTATTLLNGTLILQPRVHLNNIGTGRLILGPRGRICIGEGGELIIPSESKFEYQGGAIDMMASSACIGLFGGTLRIGDKSTLRVDKGFYFQAEKANVEFGDSSGFRIGNTGRYHYEPGAVLEVGSGQRLTFERGSKLVLDDQFVPSNAIAMDTVLNVFLDCGILDLRWKGQDSLANAGRLRLYHSWDVLQNCVRRIYADTELNVYTERGRDHVLSDVVLSHPLVNLTGADTVTFQAPGKRPGADFLTDQQVESSPPLIRIENQSDVRIYPLPHSNRDTLHPLRIESGMLLSAGTTVSIDSGATLHVAKDATLYLEAGSSFLVNPGAKVFLESGAYLCIEDSNSLSVSALGSFQVHENIFFGTHPGLGLQSNCQTILPKDISIDREDELSPTGQSPEFPITVFPNPSQDAFTVSFSLQEAEEISIELYNLQGKAVKEVQSSLTFGPGEHRHKVDVASLPSGLYFLVFRTQSDQVIRRVMIAK